MGSSVSTPRFSLIKSQLADVECTFHPIIMHAQLSLCIPAGFPLCSIPFLGSLR
eukprot:m.126563 g.126563  ORF g.126563 m.126563 type:complete len:54 (-) comp13835_c1_seq3:1021-1182(-)